MSLTRPVPRPRWSLEAGRLLLALGVYGLVAAPVCRGEEGGTATMSVEVERFRRGNPHTSRPLENMDRLFAPYRVVEILEAIDRPEPEIRVLELGMGEGRVLMQLRCRFPRMELHGINRGAWSRDPRANEAWIRETAVFFGIMTPEEAAAAILPHLHFHDVSDGRLDFLPSDYFDLVISQVSFGYIDRKDRLLEELWRVLRPGGAVLTDLDNFLLMNSGNAISLEEFFARVAAEGPDLSVGRNGSFPFLRMRKNVEGPLELGLEPHAIDFPVFVDPRDETKK